MKRIIKKIIIKYIVKFDSFAKAKISIYQKSKFKKCGDNVSINPNCVFTYETISIGNDVFIGANTVIQSVSSEIIIGNHIALGPGVNIYGSDHDYKKVGKYVRNIVKISDTNIIIEDDCWIGANVIILKGVRIGKGSIIGAGTILTHSVQPYSIVYGKAENVIKRRFTNDQIAEHEKLLENN